MQASVFCLHIYVASTSTSITINSVVQGVEWDKIKTILLIDHNQFVIRL